MGAGPRLGDIWARTGRGDTPDQVRFRRGWGRQFLPSFQICPWHACTSIVFSAAAVLPGTLDGDIDDRYTSWRAVHYIQGHAWGGNEPRPN